MNNRFAFFLPSLRGGGAERVLVTLANEFAAHGLVTDLVLSKAEGPFLDDVVPAVRIVDLNSRRVSFCLPKLVRYLRRERPQAMVSGLNHANIVASVANRLAHGPAKLVLSEHNNLTLSVEYAKILRVRLIPYFMRLTYPLAERVVAVSSGVADDLEKNIGLQRSKIEVIYNPIVSLQLSNKAKEQPVHPWFDANSPPVLLGVGRLTAQKDFSTLIRAFALLRKQKFARLVILGEGELRSQLENLARDLGVMDDVALPGFVANPLSYMRTATMFVMSSRWEGFGNVLVEAMACGTPVISTNCPSGPAEILENEKWGRLVPVGNEEALAEAMKATLNDGEHPNVILRAADFSVEQAVESYMRLLGKA